MGGGKKHKLEKAFKPLRDKFDNSSQQKSLAAQKAAAQKRLRMQQTVGNSDFNKQQQSLIARLNGPKKVSRKTLSLASPTFSFNTDNAATAVPIEATEGEIGDERRTYKYTIDRLLHSERFAHKQETTVVDDVPINIFTILEHEEPENHDKKTLFLKPALLGSFVPFKAQSTLSNDLSDDENL